MNASDVISSKESAGTSVAKIDMKLEAVVVKSGWRYWANSVFDACLVIGIHGLALLAD